ncbi:hypothetical protein L5F41_05925 [Aliarcobacter butzleri]|uniref:hypothetical protein n=1 Tax=Aliarcobacter butzleri TaxID=28197 RepID=UPI001EDC4481|nr:hypothetical protein [Aliarcobacter butzleri]MCG3701629.1 hypothetical protein [Aliarcobacter butzleri]
MEDKFIQKKDILLQFISIGETKLDEIIKNGNFVKPIPIEGFAYPLYSQIEINTWMDQQKKKRDEILKNETPS